MQAKKWWFLEWSCGRLTVSLICLLHSLVLYAFLLFPRTCQAVSVAEKIVWMFHRDNCKRSQRPQLPLVSACVSSRRLPSSGKTLQHCTAWKAALVWREYRQQGCRCDSRHPESWWECSFLSKQPHILTFCFLKGRLQPVLMHKSADNRAFMCIERTADQGLLCYMAVAADAKAMRPPVNTSGSKAEWSHDVFISWNIFDFINYLFSDISSCWQQNKINSNVT